MIPSDSTRIISPRALQIDMPYVSSGTLTTDTRSPTTSTTWDTQSDWSSYASKTDITVTSDGTLRLSDK